MESSNPTNVNEIEPKPEQEQENPASNPRRKLKRDPTGKGFMHIGLDGGVRSLDSQHNVIDARGMSSEEIKEYMLRFGGSPQDYAGINGSNLSHEELFHPPEGILPKVPTPEEKAERRRLVEEANRKIRETQDMVDKMVFPEVD
jgi:hypothetical protein